MSKQDMINVVGRFPRKYRGALWLKIYDKDMNEAATYSWCIKAIQGLRLRPRIFGMVDQNTAVDDMTKDLDIEKNLTKKDCLEKTIVICGKLKKFRGFNNFNVFENGFEDRRDTIHRLRKFETKTRSYELYSMFCEVFKILWNRE